MHFHWFDKHLESLGVGDYLADLVTNWTGAFGTFCAAVFIVILWACLGPHYNYSDTWQLVINTSTTIVTFLMVFLIQNNQNRQAARDRVQADADYHTNLAAKEEIEALQIAIARIETETLDWIAEQHRDQNVKLIALDEKLNRLMSMVKKV